MSTNRAEAEKLVMGLTSEQRASLMSFLAEPRQMGIGMAQHLPQLVEPAGFNHPLFGPHYQLTAIGSAVADHLKGTPNDR